MSNNNDANEQVINIGAANTQQQLPQSPVEMIFNYIMNRRRMVLEIKRHTDFYKDFGAIYAEKGLVMVLEVLEEMIPLCQRAAQQEKETNFALMTQINTNKELREKKTQVKNNNDPVNTNDIPVASRKDEVRKQIIDQHNEQEQQKKTKGDEQKQ